MEGRERVAQLGPGLWPLIQEPTGIAHRALDIHAHESPAEGAAAPEHPLEHRHEDRVQAEGIVRERQVDRGPMEGRADRGPLLDEVGQRPRVEVPDSGPERHVRIDGDLGLEHHEVADDLGRSGVHRFQQVLSREQGTTQGPWIEGRLVHGPMVAHGRDDPRQVSRDRATGWVA